MSFYGFSHEILLYGINTQVPDFGMMNRKGMLSVRKAMVMNMKYKDTAFSVEERVQDLMAQMTLREKLMILIETSQENPRLGIPKYFHGNEALHGVVRPGKYTVFPQAIALGATFDDALLEDIADAISDESRAMYHHGKGTAVSEEEYEGRYNGLLTFWSPDLNLCRDPRWGRTGETYGEDPYLAGKWVRRLSAVCRARIRII